MLIRLVYIATTSNMPPDQLDHFVEKVQTGARESGLGSIVVTGNNYYVHYMEGNREIVNHKYIELVSLKEHISCIIVRCVGINKPEFPDFTLAYARLSGIAKEELVKLSPTDLDTMTSSTAMLLIRRAAAHHRYDEPTLFLRS